MKTDMKGRLKIHLTQTTERLFSKRNVGYGAGADYNLT
jgi:hypothetical protein